MAHRPAYKNFGDYWIRAGLPASERLHASMTWNSAIGAACEHLARTLEFDVDALKGAVQHLKADL